MSGCPTCEGTGVVTNCPRPGWCSEHMCDGGVECPDCTWTEDELGSESAEVAS